jgi:ParB-like chromosome segregation protein Spo0J
LHPLSRSGAQVTESADDSQLHFGDSSVAANIADIGLLHPIVITPDGTIIAGKRRLEACRLLCWESVPVRVVDIDAIVRGELAENNFRKDFTPSEMVAIAETVEIRERELAGNG